jgi:hypothetical protein
LTTQLSTWLRHWIYLCPKWTVRTCAPVSFWIMDMFWIDQISNHCSLLGSLQTLYLHDNWSVYSAVLGAHGHTVGIPLLKLQYIDTVHSANYAVWCYSGRQMPRTNNTCFIFSQRKKKIRSSCKLRLAATEGMHATEPCVRVTVQLLSICWQRLAKHIYEQMQRFWSRISHFLFLESFAWKVCAATSVATWKSRAPPTCMHILFPK